MTTMKAVRATTPNMGAPHEAVQIEELPMPVAGDDECVVKLLMRPVNPADVFSLMGVYPGCKAPAEWPITPGLDGMGVVSSVGSAVTKFTVGQRVSIAGTPLKYGNGSWTEYAAEKESDLFAVPDDVSDETACQFLVNPVTVYGMLKTLGLNKGETVVVTAAGSALGRMAAPLAKHWGLKTIGTVRRDAQKLELLAAGYDAVVSSESEDITARLKEICPEGCGGVLDAVAGELTEQCCSGLKAGGTCIVYGAMSGMQINTSVVDILFRAVTLRGFWLSIFLEGMTAEEKEATFNEVMKLLQDKVISPGDFVGKTFPLEEAATAVKESAAEARGAKVFIKSG